MTRPAAAPAWLADAACRDLDPQPFIDPHNDNDITKALNVCASCKVRQPCRDVALAHHPRADVGIWGGTTAADRRHIRRNPANAATPPYKTATPTKQAGRPQTPDKRQVTRTADGDYTDAAGRTIITKLPTGDWMTLIDNRPIARTDTLHKGQEAAAQILHDGDPKQPVTRNADGDHVDAAGRTIIVKLPTGDWMTLVDNRPIARTDTVGQGQQAAWQALTAATPPQVAHTNPPRTARR